MGNECSLFVYEEPFQGDPNVQVTSFLEKFPMMISETWYHGERFLCTAQSSPKKDGIQFSVLNITNEDSQMVPKDEDVTTGYFTKTISQQELLDTRDILDVKNNISWFSFYTAVKHTFVNNALGVRFGSDPKKNDEKLCYLKIELNFALLGRTSLTVSLRRTQKPSKEMMNTLLNHMYMFYTNRLEKTETNELEQLETQKHKLIEKYLFLQKSITRVKKAGETTKKEDMSASRLKMRETTPVEGSGQKGSKDSKGDAKDAKDLNQLFEIPAETLIRTLRGFKDKLTEAKAINPSESDYFDTLSRVLSSDALYKVKFVKPSQAIDEETLKYLKSKFELPTGTESEKDDSQKKKAKEDSEEGNEKKSIGSKKKSSYSFSDKKNLLQNSQISQEKIRDQIVAMFDKIDEYDFDVFKLNKLTNGQTLFVCGYTLFCKYDLLNKFNLKESVLINFLREIQEGYHPNPYHNSMHASDVLQVLHFIIGPGGLYKYLSDDDIFAGLVSAICHDYDHPGLNNAFQQQTYSYLATLYNDRSILENHHCAQSFELIRSSPDYNILGGMSQKQQNDIRETICSTILATDMGQHARIVTQFKNKVEQELADFNNPSKDNVRLALQMAIKLADVSNPSRPLCLYLRWTHRLNEEFFKQGDKERELGFTVSPLMTRNTEDGIGKGQIAFFDYVVIPMYKTFAIFLKNMEFTVNNIQSNKEYWTTRKEIDPKDMAEDENTYGEKTSEH